MPLGACKAISSNFVCLLSHRLKVHSFASPECDHGTPCKIWRCKRFVQKLDCGQNGSYATVANINREAKRGSTQKPTTPSILHADFVNSVKRSCLCLPKNRTARSNGTVYLCFFTCVRFTTGCNHRRGLLKLRRVFSEAELETFSFSIRVDARKSTPNSRSLVFFEEGADITHALWVSGTWLSPLLLNL